MATRALGALQTGWNWLTTRSTAKTTSPETSGMAFNAFELIAGAGVAAATSWGWGTACGLLLVGHAASNLLPALTKSTNISLADLTAGFWKQMSPGTTFPDERPQATFAEISTGMLLGGGAGALFSAATGSGWNPVIYGASIGGLGKVFTSRPEAGTKTATTATTTRRQLRALNAANGTGSRVATFEAPLADVYGDELPDLTGASTRTAATLASPASKLFTQRLINPLVCSMPKAGNSVCGREFSTINQAYEHDKAELAAFYNRDANTKANREEAMLRTLEAAFAENPQLMTVNLAGLQHPEFAAARLGQIVQQARINAQAEEE